MSGETTIRVKQGYLYTTMAGLIIAAAFAFLFKDMPAQIKALGDSITQLDSKMTQGMHELQAQVAETKNNMQHFKREYTESFPRIQDQAYQNKRDIAQIQNTRFDDKAAKELKDSIIQQMQSQTQAIQASIQNIERSNDRQADDLKEVERAVRDVDKRLSIMEMDKNASK